MNRETELHFASVPTLDISRCKLKKKHDHKTTFSTGSIVPIYVDDILPGSTVKMSMASLVRMMTPIAPVMDNAFMDIMFFYVPYRLLWDHWVNFMGENDTAPWTVTQNYEVPQITAPSGGWNKGTLADYFGLPTGVGDISVSALPFRAYCKIFNDWWRDENLVTPVYITSGDSTTTGKNKGLNYDPVTDTECGAAPLKAAKYHDYFTSCLPAAQKGPSIEIPLGSTAPIRFTGTNPFTGQGALPDMSAVKGDRLIFVGKDPYAQPDGNTSATQLSTYANKVTDLYTDLSQAIGATVNQLRQSFAVQKFYERSARSGSRYIETILSHFRVTNPDFRMQRSEYMGGVRIPINMNQVVQTDASGKSSYWDADLTTPGWVTEDKTPQGNLAAYSATSHNDGDLFTHSFTEHGVLMGLAVIRTEHTYQQGINRMWSRKKMFDFYWPELANIGEMAVLNKEIYAQGTTTDDEAFGYQEAWADYRYKPSIISGELRSNYAQSLDIWHYGDDYSALPSLGSSWIEEPEENMARTLAVQNHDQFFGDFYFEPTYALPMPLYSVPGLIDHH